MDAFLLVRHARTVPDPALPSARWRLADDAAAACRALAAEVAPLGPTVVVTSAEGKAVATGALLADALELPCGSAEGLQEHDRTGAPFVPDETAWRATLRALFAEPERRVLGRESAAEALERFEAAVRRELDAHAGGTPLLVAHATVMALLVAKHGALDAYGFWRTLRMPEALVLRRSDFALVDRFPARTEARAC